jgi:hypothetical protein
MSTLLFFALLVGSILIGVYFVSRHSKDDALLYWQREAESSWRSHFQAAKECIDHEHRIAELQYDLEQLRHPVKPKQFRDKLAKIRLARQNKRRYN